MEWMYKEHPSTEVNYDSSMHDPSYTSEAINSSDEVQTREKSNPVHADGAAEDTSTTSSSSGYRDELDGLSVESRQPEGVPLVNNSGGILTEENHRTSHQSEPQNYTPYIKYTKLEFKVCVLLLKYGNLWFFS